MSEWIPTKGDFDHPSLRLIGWLENGLSYATATGDEKYMRVFEGLLREAKQKLGIITRSLQPTDEKPLQRFLGFGAMLEAAFSNARTIEAGTFHGFPEFASKQPKHEAKTITRNIDNPRSHRRTMLNSAEGVLGMMEAAFEQPERRRVRMLEDGETVTTLIGFKEAKITETRKGIVTQFV